MFNTDNYHSRFFNKIERVDDILIKSSTNIEKLVAEYSYYYFLPKNLQRYFIQPFNFKINGNIASYEMELFKCNNLAQLFQTNSIDNKSFYRVLEKIDRFKKNTDVENKKLIKDSSQYLVLEKTKNRIKEYDQYYEIYLRIEKAFNFYIKERKTWNSIISHGDLCFSNILWIDDLDLIKFIDPRGANKKHDIFMDEYYDLAKLSHSIFGGYESIIYNSNINYSDIKETFILYLQSKDISIELLKVYEASLFLSMIPLHIDNESNVNKFLLQSKKILNSIGH